MSDDVSLEDGFAIAFADEEWHRRNLEDAHALADEIRVSGLEDFVAVEEVTSESLLGTREQPILPADGILLMYGDGGAGKTTLAIDGAFHMAAARNWLGLEVARPVRSLIIENEGPRGMFRKTLGAKRDAWSPALNGEIHVLEEPWSRVTVANPSHRAGIAEAANALAVDLIILGPLATVGMVGGGTPDEISRFEGLLRELRSLVERPVALWIIHHENKSGDVSGAWERVPDTLIHVQGAGNGHTRFVFRKARWSSDYHGRTLNLTWSDGRTFDVVEETERDYYAAVLEVFEADDRWRTLDEVRRESEVGTTSCRSVLAELVRRGDLMFEKGPAGRHPTASCYRLRGATVLRLVPEPQGEAPDDEFTF